LRVLLAAAEDTGQTDEEQIPEPPADPVTRADDIWIVGQHRLLCGDCLDLDALMRLFANRKENVVLTLLPYPTPRNAHTTRPVASLPSRLGNTRAGSGIVANNIASILAPGGSNSLNIKEHSGKGERSLYVTHLVIAHQRQWGWRFVDEFS
jgi:hypothetical protein